MMIMLTVVMSGGRWTWKPNKVTDLLASTMIITSRPRSRQRTIMLTIRR
jgi:hypothetical protein